jgi:hypothetical protein
LKGRQNEEGGHVCVFKLRRINDKKVFHCFSGYLGLAG